MSDSNIPIHDIYTLLLQTIGFQELTKTGVRVIMAPEEAPVRANIGQQHDPMEMLRWSKDNDAEAIRLHVRNDFSVGRNIYVRDGIIQFTTTPAIELLVDPVTCELLLRCSGGADIYRWGCVSDPWTQINTTVYTTNGFAIGEYGVWLIGYSLANKNFGFMAKQTFFGDWDVIPGTCGTIFVDIDTPGQDPKSGADYLGRGGLFIGDNNNYRFSVNSMGRLSLAQLVAGQYQIVEDW